DAFNNEKNVNVLLIDDIIVSGGTAYAAANLIKKLNVNLVESCFLMNIAILDGAKKLSEISPVYCVLEI
ncbi:adenine phosphoribosyltransferase, partial [Aliarcobacter butzleri]|nr:adenine phosphoribosyltransferase [Aliarcobacter butzleri]